MPQRRSSALGQEHQLGLYGLSAHQASFEGPCGHDQAGRTEVLLKGLAGDRQGPALGTSQRKLLAFSTACGHQAPTVEGTPAPSALTCLGVTGLQCSQPPAFLGATYLCLWMIALKSRPSRQLVVKLSQRRPW